MCEWFGFRIGGRCFGAYEVRPISKEYDTPEGSDSENACRVEIISLFLTVCVCVCANVHPFRGGAVIQNQRVGVGA